MRAFVRLREALALQGELAVKLAVLERKIAGHDESIRALFEAIRQLMAPPAPNRPRIGFPVEEAPSSYRFPPACCQLRAASFPPAPMMAHGRRPVTGRG